MDYEEGWPPKNWCFWTVVLEKTLKTPLDCKEIQPVHSEGDQPWDFFGRNDAKAETPVTKSWLIGKDFDAGRDWGQEKKGMTKDEMAGWHHWFDERESEWTLGVGDGQGGLVCCDSWGCRVGHDWETELNWTELNWKKRYGTSGKEFSCQCRRLKRHRFDPWVGQFPWRRKWQPIPVFLLEYPMDREAWWATVHRITKSQTQLKWLSMYAKCKDKMMRPTQLKKIQSILSFIRKSYQILIFNRYILTCICLGAVWLELA